MKKLKLIFLFFAPLMCFGVDLNLANSAELNALSGLTLMIKSPSAASINPASRQEGISISGSYLYNLEEIPFYSFQAGKSWKRLYITVGAENIANSLINSWNGNVSVNLRFKTVTWGLGSHLVRQKIQNYSEQNYYTLKSGILIEHNSLLMTFIWKNLTMSSYKNRLLPVFLLWETRIKLYNNIFIGCGLEKQLEYDFTLRLAVRKDFGSLFTLMSSYQFDPDRIGAGISIGTGKYHLIYSIRTHRYLDFTHFISLNYDWQN